MRYRLQRYNGTDYSATHGTDSALSSYSQSQRENERYEHEHQQWMHACKHAKDSAQLPPEPKQPPLQSLIISGTTSYTRMQLQMRDNAEMGSLIFDTEAQSLSTANKQDYGNFDRPAAKGL